MAKDMERFLIYLLASAFLLLKLSANVGPLVLLGNIFFQGTEFETVETIEHAIYVFRGCMYLLAVMKIFVCIGTVAFSWPQQWLEISAMQPGISSIILSVLLYQRVYILSKDPTRWELFRDWLMEPPTILPSLAN